MLGRTISHYKILEKIGAGGMGEVYLAEDLKLGRRVALKFLPADLSRDSHASNRFMREARAASGLDHPNICSVHEIDTAPDGRLFICMSYCEGESLKRIVSRGPMPIDDAVNVAVKIAEGLASAHNSGVIHRDIKPANIIVSADRGVKVIDFGLAKLMGASQVTRADVTLGTIAYKSPEQTRGENIDGRTDIWSLGLVLFEMLTGESPFEADFEQATMYAILNEKPKRVTELRRDVPIDLERVVDKCLAKDRAARYQTAEELADDLDRVAEKLGLSWPSRERRKSYRGKRLRRRVVGGIAGAAAAVAAFVAIVGGWDKIETWVNGGGGTSEQHVAVLRFASVGAGESFDVFCDGLVETLTSKLTQMDQSEGRLRVVPASEIRERDIKSVGEARDVFAVNLAVTGSVQQFGDVLRVTVNVVDAETERQLESAIINDPMTDASVLQDTTVVRLAEMLDIDIKPETQRLITAGGTSVADAFALYLEGQGYLQRRERVENINKAIDSFGRALELDTVYALAYAGLGKAYWRKFEELKDTTLVSLAKTYCGRAIEIDDLLAPVHVTLGMIDRGTGQYAEAITELQRALQIDPANIDAHLELARVYADVGMDEEAEELYLEAIELRPDNWSAYSHLGFFYFMQHRLEEAVEATLKVTELYPENIRAYNNLLVFYYQLGDIDKAREMFDKSVELKPDADTYSNMGTMYILEGRYADAIPILEQAAELSENEPWIWGNLSDAYRYTPGMEHKAGPACRRAIDLAEGQLAVNPKNARLRADMAVYCAKAGDIAKALEWIALSKQQNPDDGKVLLDSGIICEIAGRREEALRELERVVEIGGYDELIKKEPELSELRKAEAYRRLVSP